MFGPFKPFSCYRRLRKAIGTRLKSHISIYSGKICIFLLSLRFQHSRHFDKTKKKHFFYFSSTLNLTSCSQLCHISLKPTNFVTFIQPTRTRQSNREKKRESNIYKTNELHIFLRSYFVLSKCVVNSVVACRHFRYILWRSVFDSVLHIYYTCTVCTLYANIYVECVLYVYISLMLFSPFASSLIRLWFFSPFFAVYFSVTNVPDM